MNKENPKARKVEMASNILKIEFDDGSVKYLKSHYNNELAETYSPSKGKNKRKNILLSSFDIWLGTTSKIEEDGTVILNENDIYTPDELWNDSKPSIQEL